jgi:glycine cleavage system aminomethyltransferase T
MSKKDILKAMSINDMVKSIDESEREQVPSWTVWVGGGEVNSYYLSETEAKDIAQAWIDKGYDDVVVEEVKGE